ncbi:MAG: CBS domain-containing protein [Gammaproteobacteria bacterium]|nr:CBS domain-containing protein [Gammaproteobacteria bacterium]MCW8909415.1 CBS domain-containing protein [Gammaproteobacteria bacterium]MCW9004451.1 CBS domain-containing protein [Gammaproteobacteria bacterium]MCW9055210.1 CBS domain-containing protein [Gammaproteobacteria bacterium]
MLDNVRVKDLYITIDDYPNVSLDAPIGHAIQIMHHVLGDKKKYRNILVLDDDDHLQGYLSLRDLIRAVGPDYLHKRQPDVKGHQPFNVQGFSQDLTSLSLFWENDFTARLHKELKKPVREYMTLMEDRVLLEDHISKCMYLMLLHDVLVLPVVENGQVIGVIRQVDLFERIAVSVEKVWLHKHKEEES